MPQSKIIEFPARKASRRPEVKRPGNDIKYFNEAQIKALRRTVKD